MPGFDGQPLCLLGLVHVGGELREVNGITVLHKRPDEISQILVRAVRELGVRGSSETQSRLPGARVDLAQSPCFHGETADLVTLQCALHQEAGVVGVGDRRSAQTTCLSQTLSSAQPFSLPPALFPEDPSRRAS